MKTNHHSRIDQFYANSDNVSGITTSEYVNKFIQEDMSGVPSDEKVAKLIYDKTPAVHRQSISFDDILSCVALPMNSGAGSCIKINVKDGEARWIVLHKDYLNQQKRKRIPDGGGSSEKGETPLQTARREAREEMGNPESTTKKIISKILAGEKYSFVRQHRTIESIANNFVQAIQSTRHIQDDIERNERKQRAIWCHGIAFFENDSQLSVSVEDLEGEVAELNVKLGVYAPYHEKAFSLLHGIRSKKVTKADFTLSEEDREKSREVIYDFIKDIKNCEKGGYESLGISTAKSFSEFEKNPDDASCIRNALTWVRDLSEIKELEIVTNEQMHEFARNAKDNSDEFEPYGWSIVRNFLDIT